MLNFDTAKLRLIQYLNQRYVSGREDIMIREDKTREKEYGWIFFIQSRRYLETGDQDEYMFVGPIVITKKDGSIYPLPTALKSTDNIIREFEAVHIDPSLWPPTAWKELFVTRLHVAATDSDNETIANLLKIGLDVDSLDESGGTALFSAILHGNSKTVKHLMRNGADVNKVLPDGTSVLMYAIMSMWFGIAKFLVHHGADVHWKDNNGDTPLTYACRHNEPGILGFVKLILGKGADVNTANSTGKTPLMLAVENGYLPTIRLLIAKGANINASDDDGKTA